MENELLAKLKKIPLFAEIKDDSDYMSELLQISRLKHFSAGEVIIKEGDIGGELYIVINGVVEIRKKTRAGDDYTVVILNSEQNVFFGELALIDDDKRSATVIASEDTDCLAINKKDFLSLGDLYPQIGLPVTRAISRILASSLRKTTQDMLTLFDALVNEIKG